MAEAYMEMHKGFPPSVECRCELSIIRDVPNVYLVRRIVSRACKA
jgi:hypothetical protein